LVQVFGYSSWLKLASRLPYNCVCCGHVKASHVMDLQIGGMHSPFRVSTSPPLLTQALPMDSLHNQSNSRHCQMLLTNCNWSPQQHEQLRPAYMVCTPPGLFAGIPNHSKRGSSPIQIVTIIILEFPRYDDLYLFSAWDFCATLLQTSGKFQPTCQMCCCSPLPATSC